MPLKRTKTVRGKRSAANWKRKENFVMWKSWKRRALAENKTDYSKYRISWQEYLLCFFKAFFATGAFTGMFYRSWLGMLAFPAVWKVLYGRDKKNRIQKRKERLSLQFKDTILMVTAGIQAGTACVDLRYADGEVLSIDCIAVEDEFGYSPHARAELDWLIYNDPLSYVQMLLDDKPEEYIKSAINPHNLVSDEN